MLPGFRLTARDIAIVEEVYQSKALTADQIAALLFTPSTVTKCDQRLRLLFDYVYLFRSEQPQRRSEPQKPLVQWIDEKGIEQVATNRGVAFSAIPWNPDAHRVGSQFLYHLLDTNTVQIAIRRAAETQGFTIVERKSEQALRLEGSQNTGVIPDYYFLLEKYFPRENTSRYLRLFIEVDRRTVTGEAKASSLSQRDWAHKVKAYLAYFHSDAYTKRYGSKAGRVLTVTTGERRARNLREITEKVGGKARFWFTTLDKVAPEIILTAPETALTAPIWSVASWKGLYALTNSGAAGER
jgi:hypothetical protein